MLQITQRRSDLVLVREGRTAVVQSKERSPSLRIVQSASLLPFSSGAGGSSDSRYLEFQQPAAQATWMIVHNFGRRPNVMLLDPSGAEVVANVQHLDANVTQVNFAVPVSGSAVLSA